MQQQQQPMRKKNAVWGAVSPFLLGGMSGMVATSCVQPIDYVKVRIQLMGEGQRGGSVNPIALASKIVKTEGFPVLYTGLSAGLLRQATYATARMGIFRTVSDRLKGDSKEALPFWKKAVAGLTAGALGSMVGTPADLALIRMQADKMLPVDKRQNYKGVFDVLSRIIKNDGVRAVFAGNTPVVVRAMSINVGMLATHDEALEKLKTVSDNTTLVSLGAKVISGFFASAAALPFDFVKTRMQKQKPDAKGVLPYKNVAHCFARVAREEGITTFYRGFWTFYFRIAPHTMVTLAVLDVLRGLTKEW